MHESRQKAAFCLVGKSFLPSSALFGVGRGLAPAASMRRKPDRRKGTENVKSEKSRLKIAARFSVIDIKTALKKDCKKAVFWRLFCLVGKSFFPGSALFGVGRELAPAASVRRKPDRRKGTENVKSEKSRLKIAARFSVIDIKTAGASPRPTVIKSRRTAAYPARFLHEPPRCRVRLKNCAEQRRSEPEGFAGVFLRRQHADDFASRNRKTSSTHFSKSRRGTTMLCAIFTRTPLLSGSS